MSYFRQWISRDPCLLHYIPSCWCWWYIFSRFITFFESLLLTFVLMISLFELGAKFIAGCHPFTSDSTRHRSWFFMKMASMRVTLACSSTLKKFFVFSFLNWCSRKFGDNCQWSLDVVDRFFRSQRHTENLESRLPCALTFCCLF